MLDRVVTNAPTTGLLLVALLLSWVWPAEGQQTGRAAERSDNGEASNAPVAWLPVLSVPGGDIIASFGPGVRPLAVEEAGEWVRVRVEGWVRRADLPATPASAELAPLTLSALRENPDAHIGSVVRWTVQNLGLQRADSLRSDMTPGQAYLLARDPGGETGLVYVTVPERLRAAAATIGPLERFEVVGRVIAGRSALTGHPILEMLEMR